MQMAVSSASTKEEKHETSAIGRFALAALSDSSCRTLALVAILGTAQATPPAGQSTEMLGRGTTIETLLLNTGGTLPNQNANPWRGTYKAPWDVTAFDFLAAGSRHGLASSSGA